MFTTLTRTAALGALATTALTFAPQDASALNFTFNGAEVPSFQRVSGAQDGGTYDVLAGAFDFTDDNTGAGSLGDFIAWCLDLDTNISTGNSYEYTESSAFLSVTPPYVAGAAGRLQDLFDKSYDLSATGVLSSEDKSAGFQIAIWEVLYDDDFSLTTGSFTATGGDLGARSAAATYLTGVENYVGDKFWNIATYQSTSGNQDLGVASAVPLPAAAWLLLGVSGALVGAKRRKRRGAAA